MNSIFLIALAGACGTLSRAGLIFLQQQYLTTFPWPTLGVNAVGCFIAGTLFMVFEKGGLLPAAVKPILFVGFLGALTTFSSYILEFLVFCREGLWLKAGLYLFFQNTAGVSAFILGAWIVNSIMQK